MMTMESPSLRYSQWNAKSSENGGSNSSPFSSIPNWSSSKLGNGPGSMDSIMGKTVNHTIASNGLSSQGNRIYQEQIPLSTTQTQFPTSFGNGSTNSTTTTIPTRGTSGTYNSNWAGMRGSSNHNFQSGTSAGLLFNTGEPVGSLTTSKMSEAVKKFGPTREELKDRLVDSLSSDAMIGILPGYKSHLGGRSFPRSFSENSERLPSPVARAQLAIGRSRQEIGAARDMIQANASNLSSFYRHPKGDPWVNPGIPGVGRDSLSLKKLKQDTYRRDLETQMEQGRLRRQVALEREREGKDHPLGSTNNYYSPYTLSTDYTSNHPIPKNSGFEFYSKQMNLHDKESPSLASLGPTISPLKTRDAVQAPANSPSKFSPWLDESHDNSGTLQMRNAHNYTSQPLRPEMSESSISTQFEPPLHQHQQQLLPQYPPDSTQYYQQQPQPNQFQYGYNMQTPLQYPMYHESPSSSPSQNFQYPQYAQTPSPSLIPTPCPSIQGSNCFPYSEPSLPSTDQTLSSPSLSPRLSNIRMPLAELEPPPPEDEPDLGENLLRQHIWQTSDQLPSEDLKKVFYKSELEKQIFQKKCQHREEQFRLIKEEEKLERSIQEYQEKMRKQVEVEQQIIRRKQKRNSNFSPPSCSNKSESNFKNNLRPAEIESKLLDEEISKTNEEETSIQSSASTISNIHHPTLSICPLKDETMEISSTNYTMMNDDKPCRSFLQVETTPKGDGDFHHLEYQRPNPSIFPKLSSNHVFEQHKKKINGEWTGGGGDGKEEKMKMEVVQEESTTTKNLKSIVDLKILTNIQMALKQENQRVKYFRLRNIKKRT